MVRSSNPANGIESVATAQSSYNIAVPALHSLHECRDIEHFNTSLAQATGCAVANIADHVLAPGAARAIFLVGSIPLGMGTSGSDIDLVVLVDERVALAGTEQQVANSDQQMEFASESDLLLIKTSLTLMQGILIEIQVVLTPSVHQVYQRLRRRGPELSEVEMRTLGRLSRGWLLWETPRYLTNSRLDLRDPSLAVYCSTRNFVSALLQRSKAGRALERNDIPLALHHGRLSVEDAYLAYFASEGLPHLGSKWLTQVQRRQGGPQTAAQHPLLSQGIPLLFPKLTDSTAEAAQYLRQAAELVASMRQLIERKVRFRIAYAACAQIVSA